MLPYYLIFFFIASLTILYEFYPFPKKTLITFICIILILFAGLRGNIGRDYENYLYAFSNIEEFPLKINELPFYEPGFIIIVHVFKFLSDINYSFWIFLFFAFMGVSLKMNSVLKMSINPFLVTLFYFSNHYLLLDMTQIRAAVAIGFFLFGIRYYISGEYLKLFICLIFALLFHYSAFLYFIIFLFKKEKYNKKFLIGVMASAIILAIIRLPLSNFLLSGSDPENTGKAYWYIVSQELGIIEKVNVFNIVFILNFISLIILIFFFQKKYIKMDKYFLILLKLNILGIFILCLLSNESAFAFRFYDLFSVCSIFTFSYLTKITKHKIITILVLITISITYLSLNLFKDKLIGPYKFNQTIVQHLIIYEQ